MEKKDWVLPFIGVPKDPLCCLLKQKGTQGAAWRAGMGCFSRWPFSREVTFRDSNFLAWTFQNRNKNACTGESVKWTGCFGADSYLWGQKPCSIRMPHLDQWGCFTVQGNSFSVAPGGPESGSVGQEHTALLLEAFCANVRLINRAEWKDHPFD